MKNWSYDSFKQQCNISFESEYGNIPKRQLRVEYSVPLEREFAIGLPYYVEVKSSIRLEELEC